MMRVKVLKKEPKKMGGYREGAGRKPYVEVRRVKCSFTLSPDTIEKLSKKAQELKTTKSSLLDEILKKYFNE